MGVPRFPGSAIPPHGVPAGVVQAYAGSTAPKGWLLCDGTAVSRTIYSRLFAVTGTTYGAGDTTTTFNLPDCTGRTIFGKEASETRITTAISGVNGGTLGAVGGSESLHGHTHTGTTSSDGAHTHTNTAINSTGTGAGLTTPGTNQTDGSENAATSSDGAHTHTFTSASTGAGSSQNLSPAIIMNYIIKF